MRTFMTYRGPPDRRAARDSDAQAPDAVWDVDRDAGPRPGRGLPAPDEEAGGGGGKAGKGGPQTIDFEDDTIEGDLTKPDGEYVEARKKVAHSNLIRIREDFEDKVMQSVGEL
ncbi:adventurous gliding motility protein CglF [Cystobacter fuscus]